MHRCFIFFIVFSASGAVSQTTASKPFVPRSNRVLKKALSVRGGECPIKADDVARFSTALVGVHSAYFSLAPKKAAEMYGLKPTPMLEWLSNALASGLATATVQSWCIFFTGTDIKTAVGVACLPRIWNNLRTLLNDKPKELEVSASGQYLILAINSFCAHALLTGAAYADTAMWGLAIWALLNGLLMGIAPQSAAKVWGIKTDDDVVFLLKGLGSTVLVDGVFTTALAMGVDYTKAFGYAWLPVCVFHILVNFVSKEADKIGLNKFLSYAWIALSAAVTGGILILENSCTGEIPVVEGA